MLKLLVLRLLLSQILPGLNFQPYRNVYENEYPPQRNQDVTVAGIENLYSLTNQNSASSNIS
ncbi:MAG: hypothetical protein EOM46_31155 [Gammaproteobacteria bacterium]|nr:hypothetical protein [Gammaproteobacteria bacterium]